MLPVDTSTDSTVRRTAASSLYSLAGWPRGGLLTTYSAGKPPEEALWENVRRPGGLSSFNLTWNNLPTSRSLISFATFGLSSTDVSCAHPCLLGGPCRWRPLLTRMLSHREVIGELSKPDRGKLPPGPEEAAHP